jgi:dTDP-glucose 4,6-dehydratase
LGAQRRLSDPRRPLLVTGSAGFIGSNFVRLWLATRDVPVVSVDALTYAGNLASLKGVLGDPRHHLIVEDIVNIRPGFLEAISPSGIIHFAAESHVDYSIESPEPFIVSNIVGTYRLLEAALAYWRGLDGEERDSFRFLHVSTDEVYGSLRPTARAADESSLYRPNSPYSASKAASDHLVRAWGRTYGLPVVTTNCTNNYGPYQHPEKLIPRMILRAASGLPLTIHGDGLPVRDWIHVEDHCRGVIAAYERGRIGEQYCIGARRELANIEVVTRICSLLDVAAPRPDGRRHGEQAVLVEERPGQDRRYALDPAKIMRETGWTPEIGFDAGLAKTVAWYLENPEWIATVQEPPRQGAA